VDYPQKPRYSFLDAVKQTQQPFQPQTSYEKPLVTVDVVLFTLIQGRLKVLMIKRTSEPYRECWAVPGGFINVGETLEEAAFRWLKQRTGVAEIYMEQFAAFGNPQRDPRARVITVSYYALVNDALLPAQPPQEEGHHEEVAWLNVTQLPPLAFDHDLLITGALHRIRERLEHSSMAFQLLPKKFTLTQLQRVYELILDKTMDKRNFRKKMLATGILKELLGETSMDGFHRPAQLYAFVPTGLEATLPVEGPLA
jgi:8-oxo-dGTP diphosphatase